MKARRILTSALGRVKQRHSQKFNGSLHDAASTRAPGGKLPGETTCGARRFAVAQVQRVRVQLQLLRVLARQVGSARKLIQEERLVCAKLRAKVIK